MGFVLTIQLIGVPPQWRSSGHRPVLHRGEILNCSQTFGDFFSFSPWQVMANQEVVDYLSQSMLVWACSVRRPEGYRVSQVVANFNWWLYLPSFFYFQSNDFWIRRWGRAPILAWQWLCCAKTGWLSLAGRRDSYRCVLLALCNWAADWGRAKFDTNYLSGEMYCVSLY